MNAYLIMPHRLANGLVLTGSCRSTIDATISSRPVDIFSRTKNYSLIKTFNFNIRILILIILLKHFIRQVNLK